MGKVYQNKTCDVCGYQGRVIATWGKLYCRKCWDEKPKKGEGHSGMLSLSEFTVQSELWTEDKLRLELVEKGNKVFSTLFLQHYPGSMGIVGRQCNYLIKRGSEVLGIIGANSPPLNYKKFNSYFSEKYKEVNWLNNNVYCLTTHEKNLGTKVLKLFRERVKADYERKYGDKLIGLITFVELPRTGAVYKADNWDYLGKTQGKSCTRRGDHGKWINKEWDEGSRKLIFAKRLIKRKPASPKPIDTGSIYPDISPDKEYTQATLFPK